MPELGVIPCGHARRLAGYLRGRGEEAQAATAVELAASGRGRSMLAESFRAVLTSILFSSKNGATPKVLVFTSPNPGEGKTTLVSNLGLALAEIHRRVVILDADLRKPRQHEIFGVPNETGLSEWLSGEVGEAEGGALIFETQFPGLYVLPAGKGSPSAANLLYSSRLAELVARLRDEFDAVLVDTPPMLTMPDARVVGRLSDGVVLVLRSRQTTRDTAQAAAQRFAEDGTPVLGTVLNDWNPAATSGGYYGYYRGYYKPYYRYYQHQPGGEGE